MSDINKIKVGGTSYDVKDADALRKTLMGEVAPTTATVGEVGQFYLDTASKKLYQCVEVADGVYTWKESGGGESPYVKVNSTGTEASASGTDAIAIGGQATANSSNSIVVGNRSRAVSDAIAIGVGCSADKRGSIVIGTRGSQTYADKAILINSDFNNSGWNGTPNSFQVNRDNIYKMDTHTLTVQNAEINGVKTYGVLTGETDPTTETVGAVTQQYQNTTTGDLFKCDKVETVDGVTTYTWSKIGGLPETIKVNGDTPADATGEYGIAIGSHSQTQGESGVAIGSNARVGNYNSIAIGLNALVSNNPECIAIGANSASGKNGSSNVAVGSYAKVENASGGVAIGCSSKAYAADGIAIGINAEISGSASYSIQLGDGINQSSKTAQFGGFRQPINKLSIYQDADHALNGTAGYRELATKEYVESLSGGGNQLYQHFYWFDDSNGIRHYFNVVDRSETPSITNQETLIAFLTERGCTNGSTFYPQQASKSGSSVRIDFGMYASNGLYFVYNSISTTTATINDVSVVTGLKVVETGTSGGCSSVNCGSTVQL